MIKDTIEESGLVNISEVEYTGNFTIKYYNRSQLELLQRFFGVRRSKFDMLLLEKRPSLLEELNSFEYEKNPNN